VFFVNLDQTFNGGGRGIHINEFPFFVFLYNGLAVIQCTSNFLLKYLGRVIVHFEYVVFVNEFSNFSAVLLFIFDYNSVAFVSFSDYGIVGLQFVLYSVYNVLL
jgi:hypothetical protein